MNSKSRMAFKKVMSVILSLLMILSSIVGTGFYNVQIAQAVNYKPLASVVNWALDNEAETTSGRADEKYITAENIFKIATEQMKAVDALLK